jgi:hypothetical protein
MTILEIYIVQVTIIKKNVRKKIIQYYRYALLDEAG